MVESTLGIREVDAAKIKAKMKGKDGTTPVDELSTTHGDTAVPTLLARALADSARDGSGGGDAHAGVQSAKRVQGGKMHGLPPPTVV